MIVLARQLARRAHRRYPMLEFDDLQQITLIAGWRASKRWQPDGGASMRSYTAHRMQGAILDLVRTSTPWTQAEYQRWRDQGVPLELPVSLESLRERLQSTDLDIDPGEEEPGYAWVDASVTVQGVLADIGNQHAAALRERYLKDRGLRELGKNDYGITETGMHARVRRALKTARAATQDPAAA